jgi:nucleoside-diphosphate-sugar epimerase
VVKVFLTGGSGYVGRNTITALVRSGHEVSALARSDIGALVVSELGGRPVPGRLTDTGVLHESAAAADAVIHLGQQRGPDTARVDRDAADALQDGIGGRGVYVHTGGVWVYGDTDGVVDESAPQNPPWAVAWRGTNEQRVLSRAARGGRPVLVMPGLVYGHHDGLIEQHFVAPSRSTGSVAMIGEGRNHWALVHVEDIADLYVLALDAPAGSVYAGVSANVPVIEVIGALTEAAGCPGEISSLSFPQAEGLMGPLAEAFALDQRLSADRARRELGWGPRHLDPLAELRVAG